MQKKPAEPVPRDYKKETLQKALQYTAGLGTVSLLGFVSPNAAFSNMFTTFGLAGIVGASPFIALCALRSGLKGTLQATTRCGR